MFFSKIKHVCRSTTRNGFPDAVKACQRAGIKGSELLLRQTTPLNTQLQCLSSRVIIRSLRARLRNKSAFSLAGLYVLLRRFVFGCASPVCVVRNGISAARVVRSIAGPKRDRRRPQPSVDDAAQRQRRADDDDDDDRNTDLDDKYDVNDESSVRIKKLRAMELQPGGALSLEPADASLAVVHGRSRVHVYLCVGV